MDWKNLIVTDSDVLFGKPVVKGTRLSAEFLLGLKAADRSNKPILENSRSWRRMICMQFMPFLVRRI